MKKSLILISLFTASCMQSSLLYIKHPKPQPLFTPEQILGESGLIFTESAPQTPVILHQGDLPTATIDIPSQRTLATETKTVETSPGSMVTLTVNTQNRYIATVFYSSAGFIYMRESSTPPQGKFVFQAGDQSGEVRIRLYQKDGTLLKESRFFIEVRQP